MKLMIRAHDLSVKGEKNMVQRLNELNLEGVQLVAYKSMEDIKYEVGSITKRRAEEIASVLHDGKKEIGLLGAYFNPVHPDETIVTKGIQIFKEYIRLAKTFKANAVGSETGSYQGEPWIDHPQNHTQEALDRVVEVFGELAECAKQEDIYLGMEGACSHVCNTPERLKEAIDRISQDNVKVIFDLYSFLNLDNVHDVLGVLKKGIELFKGKILLFHLKDFVLEDGKIKQVAVGKGIMDYDRILEVIYDDDPEALLILEGTDGDDLAFAVEYIRCRMQRVSEKH